MRRAKGLYKRGRLWWLGVKGPNGKTYYESTGTEDMRLAETRLAERKQELQENKLQKIGECTFEALAREYLTWAKRQKAYESKYYHVRYFLKVFGNLPLQSFTTKLVENWQSKRLQEVRPSSANRQLATLKHMFTKAVDWEMVGDGPWKAVRKVKLLPVNNRRLRYLSQEECQALIEACSPHLRPIVVAALNSGMRLGEILGLRWESVDLTHSFILLDQTKNGERREIPINATLRKVFESIPHSLESEFVFTDRNGNPYQGVKTSFGTALKRTGIRDFRFHDLRHCFASHLAMGGVDLNTIRELLGHKTLTMTLRYAHLSPGHKAEAVRILDGRLKISEDKTTSVYYNPTTVKHKCFTQVLTGQKPTGGVEPSTSSLRMTCSAG